MDTIAAKLDAGRQTLLDLSTRNRLLSIPARAGKHIHLYDEKTAQVWQLLVRQEKSFTFLPGKKADGTPDDTKDDEAGVSLPQPEDDEADAGGVAARHRDTKLQTKLASDKLQDRLLEMFYDARTFIEEQGVNILYLALGHLRWFEDKSPDKERLAPLILLPVALTRKSAAERFHLSGLQEDAAENLSLAAKLKADFGLVLPEFKSGDDFDPEAYLAAVADAVRSQQGWAVLPDAMTLGFFSFAKFLMYRDLEAANWPEERKIDAQPLVQRILQDGFPPQDDPWAESVHIDQVLSADEQKHVVDADSSQTLAVEAVRQGRDLVIQGPPGTGKSQTITNVIAAAVADGKKVLFVSEKMAALEVVHRRLTAIGLGPACLELHSNRANKKVVLEELKATRDLGKPRVVERDQVVQKLQALRERLNEHAETMHAKGEPFRLNAYEVLGQLARLSRFTGVSKPEYAPAADKWAPDDLAKRQAALRELLAKAVGLGAPATHSWRGVTHRAVLKLDADNWLADSHETSRLLQAAFASSAKLATALDAAPATTRQDRQQHIAIGQKIAAAPPLDRQAIVDDTWSEDFEALAEFVAAGNNDSQQTPKLQAHFHDTAWQMDVQTVRRVLAERGTSLFRIFSGEYRDAVRKLRGQLKGPLPGSLAERLALVDALAVSVAHRKTVRDAQGLAQAAFGSLWKDERTDWPQLAAVIDWVRGPDGQVLPEPVRQFCARVADLAACGTAADEAQANWQRFDDQIAKVQKNYALDLKEAFGVDTLRAVDLDALELRLQAWIAQPGGIFPWSQYFAARAVCRDLGLAALVQAFEEGRLELDVLEPVFLRAFHEAVLRALCARYPQLVEFDGEQHSRRVDEFRALDVKRIEVARAETALKHFEAIPRGTGGIGPMAVLNGEIARKRGHMSLRRLIRQAGPAIQAIKPVFMMSPLSVAQFLEPGAIDFDLLVIDEASQIEPVDAIGAIARCKQMVVVGDDRQLPPTRFFARMTSEEVPDDDDVFVAPPQDVESILSLCVSRGMGQKMLRWHYRSRHQSLIAVSNQEFYENRLFIVPSPTTTAGRMGLRFHHVKNGVFDTGGTRVNREEARVIAQAILEHALRTPELSLGVASFSLQQKLAIQGEVEALRRSHPEAEPFFSAHPNEPFFIKNLENVQGDERDVIFISVAYARSPSGVLAMRFGPVGADGGERRLNVLISRAKQRCEVFSSITSDDIDLERSRGKGVAALKVFLKFAETGELDASASSGEASVAALDEDIAEALAARGLKVDRNVGIAGFFIDLAVADDEHPGRYLLGIELDGEGYHAQRSARDRDRLRQSVLRDHGWALHRVWASDWFRRPDVELGKIVEAVEAARAEMAARDRQVEVAINPTQPVTPAQAGAQGDVAAAPSGTPSATAVPAPGMQFSFFERDDTAPQRVSTTRTSQPYIEASFDVPRHKELPDIPPYRLAEFTRKVVELEGPIHTDEIVTRLRGLWGLQRAGSRVREAIEASIELLVRDGTVVREGAFVDFPDRSVRIRSRAALSSSTLRKPENIAPAEIRRAIHEVLKESLGGQREEIAPAVAKALGLAVVTSQVREAVDRQVDQLVAMQRLQVNGVVIRVVAE